MGQFPSLKGRQLLQILEREPLRYRVARQKGSHRTMQSGAGYPVVRFSFHDQQDIRPRTVKKVLCDDVGLDEAEALRVL
jgi:predicted RNA binding protein YcfA (HicA-like mRNA interferase family)